MKNRNELFIVVATSVFLTVLLFSSLGMGTGCGTRSAAKAAQCTSNMKQFAQSNYLYSAMNNGFVTPIAWGDGVNIWPAILWNEMDGVPKMPYSDYEKDKDKWLSIVKTSHLFECPADKDTASIAKSNPDIAPLSYAINRSAVRNMKSSDGAASIPNGPVLRTTKFKIPSQMIYSAETAWNKSASVFDAPGRLYSTKSHPSYNFKPGSICHHWDQSQLGIEFSDGSAPADPWHVGKTWNYSFIDGHAANYRPEQTIKSGRNVSDREPSGYWTWNQNVWGAED